MPSQPSPVGHVPLLAKVLKFLVQLLSGFAWIYAKVIYPVTSRVWAAFRWVFWKYHKNIWERFVYLKTGHFSWMRSGLVILGTLGVFYAISPVLWTMFDTSLFAVTYRNERIFLTDSDEVDPDSDIHSVRGCEVRNCSEADTVYFRVRPTFFNHMWAYMNRRHAFYADRTASVVAPGINDCQVQSYGFRFKFLMRNWDIYPDMLDAVCRPIGADVSSAAAPSDQTGE